MTRERQNSPAPRNLDLPASHRDEAVRARTVADANELTSVPGKSFLSADDRLELAIEATRQALLGAKTRAIRTELAEQMKRLIGQRSPWKVAQMERERGLR